MMKELEEYELTQESENELYGFTASCFVKNGIVWNEYYVAYKGLDLDTINDNFYENEDTILATYSNLPLAYFEEDDTEVDINKHIMYSQKYDFPSIAFPEFVCNINEDMEVEAIHSVDIDGNPIVVDVRIDHKHDIIYVTNTNNLDKQTILYFDKSGRIIKSDLILNSILVSIDKFIYDDINHEIKECVSESEELVYSVDTKTDNNGRKLYMIYKDELNKIVDMIGRRINVNENMFIELHKFRIDDGLDNIDFDD